MKRFRRLATDRAGAAAAEMALVVPIFVVLIFGTFELGHFFMSEHVVQKSVRDAARYAARLPVSRLQPGTCDLEEAAKVEIRTLARTGNPYPNGGNPRLQGWTNNAMTAVNVACVVNANTKGIYEDFPGGAPIITVSAVVPYPTLFGRMGLGNANTAACQGASNDWLCLTIGAQSQSAMFGA